MGNCLNSKHSEFVLCPISETFQEGLNACTGLTSTISLYPISEYIMQSVFLNMTGALEQKMRCICWDMATNDYEYRFEYLNKRDFGEYSDYKAKNLVYKDLLSQIKLRDKSFSVSNLNFLDLINSAKQIIVSNKDHNMFSGYRHSLDYFINNYYKQITTNQLGQKTNGSEMLFQTELQNKYKILVYDHRNRLAHNTLSYQRNYADFKVLQGKDSDNNDNYFFRFSIICLMDLIFMDLFRRYLGIIE